MTYSGTAFLRRLFSFYHVVIVKSLFMEFFTAVTDVGMQPLKHALKILSETEKQLRTSKNQATWLTVALLQFSTEDSLYPRTNSLRGMLFYATIIK